MDRPSSLLPSAEVFASLAAAYRLVPLAKGFLADRETPITLFEKIRHLPGAFLLESVEGGERISRYSFLGWDPFLTIEAHDTRYRVQGLVREEGEGNPVAVLRRFLRDLSAPVRPDLPRFHGGAVGYLGHDAVRWVEHLPHRPADPRGLPDMYFMFPRVVVSMDHLRGGELTVVVIQPVEEDDAYRQGIRRLEEAVALLRGPAPGEGVRRGGASREVGRSLDEEGYTRIVQRAQEYIAQGDIFQVVLGQQVAWETEVDSLDVYRALRSINPSPYHFLLQTGQATLVGASPEMMVRVQGGAVQTAPIAGTRPRGSTAAEDREREAELLADPKERAEHIMLVDLSRNDVGRVAEYGSVRVERYLAVERFSHVMHLVAEVSGRLQPGRDALDALLACFPAGTLSGAPKVRALEIIDELEPVGRGPYGGAVGYFGLDGNLDTCIAIRMAVMQENRIYFQAGAGIVADSVPASEWRECEAKIGALKRAVTMVEEGALA